MVYQNNVECKYYFKCKDSSDKVKCFNCQNNDDNTIALKEIKDKKSYFAPLNKKKEPLSIEVIRQMIFDCGVDVFYDRALKREISDRLYNIVKLIDERDVY